MEVMTRRVKFKDGGENPDIGTFEAGMERAIPEQIAVVFIARGLAEDVKPKQEHKSKDKKTEVEGHG